MSFHSEIYQFQMYFAMQVGIVVCEKNKQTLLLSHRVDTSSVGESVDGHNAD